MPLSEAITVKGKIMVKVAINYDVNAFANNVFIFIIIYMQFFFEGGPYGQSPRLKLAENATLGSLRKQIDEVGNTVSHTYMEKMLSFLILAIILIATCG